MSLSLDFNPHSWYMGAAIKKTEAPKAVRGSNRRPTRHTWSAYLEDGMRGHVVDFEADNLADLKQQIKGWTERERARIARLYK